MSFFWYCEEITREEACDNKGISISQIEISKPKAALCKKIDR